MCIRDRLNLDYPTPSTGNWSDHASFRNKLPYLYFEAVNWELPDDPDHPEEGSSGAYETEIGEVMHVPDRDNLDFIESKMCRRDSLRGRGVRDYDCARGCDYDYVHDYGLHLFQINRPYLLYHQIFHGDLHAFYYLLYIPYGGLLIIL